MQRKKETTPSRQANRVASKDGAMVSQPVRFSKSDRLLSYAMAVFAFAFVAWNEAGAVPAISGIVASMVIVAAIESAWKDVSER